jgi:hypothetical protein
MRTITKDKVLGTKVLTVDEAKAALAWTAYVQSDAMLTTGEASAIADHLYTAGLVDPDDQDVRLAIAHAIQAVK